jgi:hypothetical protein
MRAMNFISGTGCGFARVARAPSPAKIHHKLLSTPCTKRVYTRARQLLQEGAGAAMKTLSHSEIYFATW